MICITKNIFLLRTELVCTRTSHQPAPSSLKSVQTPPYVCPGHSSTPLCIFSQTFTPHCRPLLHTADPKPVKTFITPDIRGEDILSGCLDSLGGGMAGGPGRQWSDHQVSAGPRLLPGRADAVRMDAPSPTRRSRVDQRSRAGFFSASVLAAASTRGSPRDRRVLSCPLLLIADNALKIQSRICSFQHEYRGIYVVCNDRV